MKLFILHVLSPWLSPVIHSSLYRSWLTQSRSLKFLQKKFINIACLSIIAINLLVSLLYLDTSYQFYGIISLIALGILLSCKIISLSASRWIFIAGLNSIFYIITILNSQSAPLQFLFILSIPISFFLFHKDEIAELGISFTVPVLLFIMLQIPEFDLQAGENQFGEISYALFIINIICILASVGLAIMYVFILYEKSNHKLRVSVRQLQQQEKEITFQNHNLLTLNASLLQSQKELKESEHFLHTIVDNLPVMLFVKDAEKLNLIRINKTGQRLLSASEQELQLQSKLSNSGLQNVLYSCADTEILQKGEIIEQEEEIINKNNENFVLQTKKVPIYNSDGKPLYVLGISEDITRRKLAEVALKKTVDELKIRNHELDNYVYRVSHDLRAPFCSMQGLINLSKYEQDTEALKQYLDLIEKSVHKSDQFIQSLLNHTKIVNTELQVSKIDFEKIIQHGFEDACAAEGIHSIVLETCICKEPIYSDRFRMDIIIRNIISNAVRYMNPAVSVKFIKVAIDVMSQDVRITVTDNGLGIEETHLPKIFNMFFRGSEKSTGSGLGLYIVQQAIEKLNGTVLVKSKPNKGTVVTLQFCNMLPG